MTNCRLGKRSRYYENQNQKEKTISFKCSKPSASYRSVMYSWVRLGSGDVIANPTTALAGSRKRMRAHASPLNTLEIRQLQKYNVISRKPAGVLGSGPGAIAPNHGGLAQAHARTSSPLITSTPSNYVNCHGTMPSTQQLPGSYSE